MNAAKDSLVGGVMGEAVEDTTFDLDAQLKGVLRCGSCTDTLHTVHTVSAVGHRYELRGYGDLCSDVISIAANSVVLAVLPPEF